MSKWKKVKLGDIATYINGCAFKPSDWSNQGVPIVRIQNLTGSFSETNYYDKHYNSKYEINNGDVLISWSASLGVYVWDKGKAILNQHIFKVVFNKIDIDKTYFIFAVKSLLEKMEKQTHGATMKHITKPLFDNMEFPFPPMEEQKKIAARLDAVSDLLAKQKQLLSEQDNLIQSLFYDMFLKQNFSKRKIVDFVETDVKNAKKIFNKNNFIKYIDISSIDNNSNIITGYTHIEFCDAPSRAQQVVKKNDILVSTVRPNLKNIALIKFNDNNLVASSGFCVLRAKNIEPVFLLYNVLSQDFTEKMVSAVTGANYPAIKNSDILNYKIPVPPLELQEKFAAIVEQIESEKSKIKSAIAETQTLFNALMSEYFEE